MINNCSAIHVIACLFVQAIAANDCPLMEQL